MGRSVENAPDGDGGAEHTFELEAYVWCPREAAGRDGSLTGIAFYLHTEKGDGLEDDPEEGGFYRLVCNYRFGEGGSSLAYLEANIARQPMELEDWPLIAQTAGEGGPGWHHVTVAVEQA